MGKSGGERMDDRGDNNSKDTFLVDFCSQVIKYNEHNSYQVHVIVFLIQCMYMYYNIVHCVASKQVSCNPMTILRQ